jgi:hypothetical protein
LDRSQEGEEAAAAVVEECETVSRGSEKGRMAERRKKEGG